MKQILILIFAFSTFQLKAQNHWIRIELDVKNMLNPSCNLNEGILDDDKVYAHIGLCSCLENEPLGPDNRDCSNEELNQIFCTTQITPYQSRVWQHVVGNWGEVAEDDGIGLMTYEGDSVWSMEFIVQDYFTTFSQDNDSSIVFTTDLKPYTLGLVFRSSDGFYSGRDNGCNDIFITGILDYNPQVIQSTDLSIFTAVKVIMEETTSVNNQRRQLKIESYPIPSKDKKINFKFNKRINNPLTIKVHNTIGQLVYSNTNLSINSNIYTHNLNKLDSGLYFVILETDQQSYITKIILR